MAEYIEREAVLAEIENDYKGVEKIKTPFAKIIVGGSAEKPYYSIMWWDMEQKECNIGYSSYFLDYVFKWLKVCFEVADDFSADVAPVVHGRWVLNKVYGDYECSVCEQGDIIAPYFERLRMHYCPNCGARMDGE